ncbi:colicin release lysis protein [Escherichia coli]
MFRAGLYVQGGTVSPSSSAELTGLETQ